MTDSEPGIVLKRPSLPEGGDGPTADQPRQQRPNSGPLSFSQQRLWFLEQLYEGSASYNEASAYELRGLVDVGALEASIAFIVERHDVLRTTYHQAGDGVVQVVQDHYDIELPVIDLRHLDPHERWFEMERQAKTVTHQAFDLERDLMLRLCLYCMSDDLYVFLFVYHHIAWDGWSGGVFWRELSQAYNGLLQGRPPNLEPLPLRYVEYAIRQHQDAGGNSIRDDLIYWQQQLAGLTPLELPSDRPRSLQPSFEGAEVRADIPDELAEAMSQLARRARVTPFMFLSTIFFVLLHRYTGQQDIAVGTPVAGRNSSDLEGMIGFFVNTLVLRADLTGEPTFSEFLGRIRQMAMEAYVHQNAPFEEVIEAVQPDRHLSRNPLFQVLFQTQTGSASPASFDGLQRQLIPIDFGIVKFDLQVALVRHDGKMVSQWVYRTDMFDKSTVERMAGHFVELMKAIVADPDQPVGRLNMLREGERERILVTWNKTSARFEKHLTLPQFLERTALRIPDEIALVAGGKSYSYAMLNEHANQLARYLTRIGLGSGAPVALMAERGRVPILAIIAILKTGSAYVPVDPRLPVERQRIILRESGAQFLLYGNQSADAPVLDGVEAVDLSHAEAWQEESVQNLPSFETGAPAYILYTSGSTGLPKGVAQSHGALSNLLQWQATDDRLGRPARTLQFAPLSFDVSFQEMFSTWQTGGTLVAIEEESRLDPRLLIIFLEQQKIERLYVPYVALQLLAGRARQEGRLPSYLADVISAGEQLVLTDDIAWFFGQLGNCRLHNHYGPTETHAATAHTLGRDVAQWPPIAPIGKPIANTRIYLLDKLAQPVPEGILGELYIGGSGLALGYWRQPPGASGGHANEGA